MKFNFKLNFRNLKKKIMLAFVAGMMLCANGAWAAGTGTLSGGTGSGSDYIGTGAITISAGTDSFTYSRFIGQIDSLPSGNSVTITGGSLGDNNTIVGVMVTIFDGPHATGNTVTISGGTFGNNNKIYGASSSSNGTYEGNSIKITGGSFGSGTIICCADSYDVTIGNTVEISGGSFGDGTQLCGGNGMCFTTPNTLNLKIKMSGKAASVSGFQVMNFVLPAGIRDGDKIMLKTESVTYPYNTTIGVTVADGAYLKEGDVITLIKADNRSGEISNNGKNSLVSIATNVQIKGEDKGEPEEFAFSERCKSETSEPSELIEKLFSDLNKRTYLPKFSLG